MTTYTHFGKQADVFKHLILCEALQIERPQVYVETNSASAIYKMAHTPEQEYGIYHFLRNAEREKLLKASAYYKLESKEIEEGYYLGSPALAMMLSQRQAQKFHFFDIEKEALEDVENYAKASAPDTRLQTYNIDSIAGVMRLLPSLPASSFIHIDPYEIDKKGNSGNTYLDVLVEATRLGMKCLLWYGFMTEDDEAHLNRYISKTLKAGGIKDYTHIRLTMNSIQKDTVACNPGVLGSGILATNLSQESHSMIISYTDKLVGIYEGAMYKGCDGSLHRG